MTGRIPVIHDPVLNRHCPLAAADTLSLTSAQLSALAAALGLPDDNQTAAQVPVSPAVAGVGDVQSALQALYQGDSSIAIFNFGFIEAVVGTMTYAAFLASLSPHVVSVTNPWADRSAVIVARGGARIWAGWEGQALSADIRPTAAGAVVAIANVDQTSQLGITTGGGMELYSHVLGVVGPGATTDIPLAVTGAISLDAVSNGGQMALAHTYSIELHRYS